MGQVGNLSTLLLRTNLRDYVLALYIGADGDSITFQSTGDKFVEVIHGDHGAVSCLLTCIAAKAKRSGFCTRPRQRLRRDIIIKVVCR